MSLLGQFQKEKTCLSLCLHNSIRAKKKRLGGHSSIAFPTVALFYSYIHFFSSFYLSIHFFYTRFVNKMDGVLHIFRYLKKKEKNGVSSRATSAGQVTDPASFESEIVNRKCQVRGSEMRTLGDRRSSRCGSSTFPSSRKEHPPPFFFSCNDGSKLVFFFRKEKQ